MASGSTAKIHNSRQTAQSTLKKVEDVAASTAKKVSRNAKGAAAEVVGQAESLAEEAVSAAKSRADEVVQVGKSRTENVVRSLSRAMEAGSNSLAQDGMTGTAGYVRAAADGLTSAADEVDGFQPGALTHRVENFVRERPMLTVGALALAGFALASALKPPRKS
ncbi:hypothetical protein R2A130_1107 [Ahrensia sp. R2A130]|nr:hypothetical protein R2A130_1107 [Ahrensia sp. R2A130]